MGRYLVQTFGCQMNAHDSERIADVLTSLGHVPAEEPALADLIVVNTCSVREKAEHKLMSLLGTLKPWKEQGAERVLVVAGCVAQQEGERLLKRAPHVDLVLGPDNIVELPRLLAHAYTGGAPMARTEFDLAATEFLEPRPAATGPERVTRYVTVMKGCDERCTFCVVPYTRGPERYRPSAHIIAEIAAAVEQGTREVTLLGQTVNSWYEPAAAPSAVAPLADDASSQFAWLLRRIAVEIPGLVRLRYTSPHPRHVTPELLAAHGELDLLPAHVHLPVQSGSDRVLKRMLRRYTRAQYIERAQALRGAREGLTLSTDLIVGFPGETEADFLQTLSLVREVGFTAAFAFKYSPRPHTPALRLGDDVPEEVKDERLARVFEVIEMQQSEHLRRLEGSVQEVLVEGTSPGASDRYMGRTSRNEIVHLRAPEGVHPVGRVVEVLIDHANRHSLSGSMAGAARGSAVSSPSSSAKRRLPVASSEVSC